MVIDLPPISNRINTIKKDLKHPSMQKPNIPAREKQPIV